MKSADSIRLGFDELKVFCEHVFAAFGFSEEDSRTVTDVLLAADLAGITSHGVQRLVRYYKEINELGYVDMKSTPEIVRETPVSAVMDAHNGMGQVVSVKAMNIAIAKAKKSGIGMVPVRNSNHFGIAGYYAHMAVSQGLIGVAMTNSEAIMVPTFGKKAMLGTNPIAFAMPAKPFPFVFDSATTVVPRGKLEVVVKRGGVIPEGWAVDERGLPCTDAARVLGNIINKAGGGILPLGGAGEDTSGHKGYGFGMVCEIMTAILSGGTTSEKVYRTPSGSGIAHFFMAIDPALFGDARKQSRRLSAFMAALRESSRADGAERIYVHGEKEEIARRDVMAHGVPVQPKTWEEMRAIASFTDTGDYLPSFA
jgi:LDH2 family malate/lactate/ureidoglycolate dehydrogenase